MMQAALDLRGEPRLLGGGPLGVLPGALRLLLLSPDLVLLPGGLPAKRFPPFVGLGQLGREVLGLFPLAIRHGALDDFKSMGEVITRRFPRLAEGDEDASFAAAPDLVVIDGGKGQLNAAITAMRGVDAPRVAVIGLAKREEEVFLPGEDMIADAARDLAAY